MTKRRADLDRAADAIRVFLEAVGAPMGDPELANTGKLVAEAFANDLLSGYAMDPANILANATGATAKGMVILLDIPTTTTCPHHLMPATGVAHVGYLPGSRVVGLGALAKVVDWSSRRLVLQEQLGQDVASALVTHLDARAAACVLSLSSTCVTARGTRRHGARTVTHAWSGEEADQTRFRTEFLEAMRAADAPQS